MEERASYSQSGQDRYVAEVLFKERRGGFFVEAGAADGLWISNTLLLERKYGWTGILVEPTRAFTQLQSNRQNCRLENACLAGVRKTLTLVEIFDAGQAMMSPEARNNLLLSRTVDVAPEKLSQMDSWWGRAQKQYEVQAKPLAEVLKAHDAPNYIDYLSLDVEGFEYEILSTFPFDEYRFGCLGIEKATELLTLLLAANGYVPVRVLGEDTFFLPADR
ncbi:MAG: FkbM family methyltransferase [Rhodospirillaceae bacterium]|nr:FkbM family methyltransferase [Rhodospirillaceae bacterium]